MMFKQKAAIITTAIIILSVIVGVILVKTNQDIREKAAPLTNLSFSPSALTIIRGNNFTSNVKIDTGTNTLTGIDIELIYNPAIIQLTGVTPTSVISSFTNATTGQVIKNNIDSTNGKARFIAYTSNKTLGVTGAKNILTITGTVAGGATAGTYQINYGPLTAVAALNEGQNSVLNKTGFNITVTNPTPTATATATAQPTATSTPTVTPTPTVLPTATPVVYFDWDVDQNTFINVLDIGIVVDNYDLVPPNNPRADVDKDGNINIIDIGIIIDHYL